MTTKKQDFEKHTKWIKENIMNQKPTYPQRYTDDEYYNNGSTLTDEDYSETMGYLPHY